MNKKYFIGIYYNLFKWYWGTCLPAHYHDFHNNNNNNIHNFIIPEKALHCIARKITVWVINSGTVGYFRCLFFTCTAFYYIQTRFDIRIFVLRILGNTKKDALKTIYFVIRKIMV